MKKHLPFIGIIITVFILLPIKHTCAAETKEGSSLTYPEQVKLYRKLITGVEFKYQYKIGDRLKYKIQMKTWANEYIDAGPRAFHPSIFDLIIEEEVKSVTDSNIELAVSVTYKNTREPLYWGGSISVYETNGKVLVNLDKNSWKPKISNINTKRAEDFAAIETVLKKVMPQITNPVFFPDDKLELWDFPGYLKKNIDIYPWGTEADNEVFTADAYSIIRNFEECGNFKCAVIDDMIEVRLSGKGKMRIFGTVYFDYENGRVVKLEHCGSDDSRSNNKNRTKDITYTMLSAEILE